MEFYPDNIAKVQAQKSAGLAFVNGNFQMVANAKQTEFFSFRYFVVMPAQLGNGFAFSKIERKIAVALYFGK